MSCKRPPVFAAVLLLLASACGQPAPQTPLVEVSIPAEQTWFLCDSEGVIFLASAPDAQGALTLAEFSKARGGFVASRALTVPSAEGVAATTPLSENGAEVGVIRQEPREHAWTAPVVGLTLDGRDFACRFAPRTRMMAFDAGHLFIATRGEDGALSMEAIAHSGGSGDVPARLSRGTEEAGRVSVSLSFDEGQDRYILHAGFTDIARLHLWRAGERVWLRPMLGRVIGDDPEAAANPLRTPASAE